MARMQQPMEILCFLLRVCIHEKYVKHLALACVTPSRLRQQTETNLQLLAGG